MAAIGMAVGVTGFGLHLCIHGLSVLKHSVTRWLVAHTHILVAWLFNLSYSLSLVLVSTYLVVNVSPEAGGAGVAEVMAYLNGCFLPRIFSARTFIVKFFSAATAVASGLPVGPEGPMVHMGAIIGAGFSQGRPPSGGWFGQAPPLASRGGASQRAGEGDGEGERGERGREGERGERRGGGSSALHLPGTPERRGDSPAPPPASADAGPFLRFRNPKDKRDFVTAGAAAGIAAA
ncbi:hypothetical protein H632_c4169p0, partial [Helicosporidium sp. ATCC 50920]